MSTAGQPAASRRCLITERHDWETGGREQQLQFVLETARNFFGSDAHDKVVTIRFHATPDGPIAFQKDITISRRYDPRARSDYV